MELKPVLVASAIANKPNRGYDNEKRNNEQQ